MSDINFASNTLTLTIAQISDSHLFSSKSACHHGANVYHNLVRVLATIKQDKTINLVVFTGDLTQDHTEQSYQNFVNAWEASDIDVPLVYVPGNHDCPILLEKHLQPLAKQSSQFAIKTFGNDVYNTITFIESTNWQLVLINSKSETPAGQFDAETFAKYRDQLSSKKPQLLFMHHHPLVVGYFIDDHGLMNKVEFWAEMYKTPNINGIACGHIHRGLQLTADTALAANQLPSTGHSVDIYTCPATSIQFDPNHHTVSSSGEGPGYRTFILNNDAKIKSTVTMLPETPIVEGVSQ